MRPLDLRWVGALQRYRAVQFLLLMDFPVLIRVSRSPIMASTIVFLTACLDTGGRITPTHIRATTLGIRCSEIHTVMRRTTSSRIMRLRRNQIQ